MANATLVRAALGEPPAHKKHEIKDTAIWETMLQLCKEINTVVPTIPVRAFYTVNTDDFADKSVSPNRFNSKLLGEASLLGFECYLTIDEVNALIP